MFFYFQVIDISEDESSGNVEIVRGGVNERFVELHFESRIGGSLKYVIQVYTVLNLF